MEFMELLSFLQPASLAPSTPLTGRVYLKEKDLLVTPVSSATQSVSRLQSMVAGLRTAPSENLMQIFKSVFILTLAAERKLVNCRNLSFFREAVMNVCVRVPPFVLQNLLQGSQRVRPGPREESGSDLQRTLHQRLGGLSRFSHRYQFCSEPSSSSPDQLQSRK